MGIIPLPAEHLKTKAGQFATMGSPSSSERIYTPPLAFGITVYRRRSMKTSKLDPPSPLPYGKGA